MVNDYEQNLENQIRNDGCKVYTCTLDDLLDPTLYENSLDIDWLICVTQGMRQKREWVMQAATTLPKQGFCFLDRITLLEPTRTRRRFLNTYPLQNLIVLSPRPAFRADNKQQKDSVTSAWFVFCTNRANEKNTEIDYALNWHRPMGLHGE